MATLLNINGVDYTNNVKIDSYVVNAAKVYSEWTDANGTIHRQIIREKVSGSFTLAFATKEEYSQFIDHLEESEVSGGYVPTYLFVNNKDDYKSCNLFYSFEPSIIGTGSGEYVAPFQIKISER